MTKRLSAQDIEAICNRVEEAREYGHEVGGIVFGDVPALLAEVERLRKELAESNAQTDTARLQVRRYADALDRLSAKYEDMTSIALWATRRLSHQQRKDFAYDAIERNLGREVERI